MKMSTYPVEWRANSRRLLRRVVWGLLAAVLLVSAAFAGYYYWDRYTVRQAPSPERQGLAHLEQLARQNSQDPEARLALAQAYLEGDKYTQAVEQAQQVLRAYPERQEALLIAGLAYTRAGQPQAAIDTLEKLAAARRQSSMASIDSVLQATLYYLGENYVRLNRPAQAILALSEALTIDRTDADALYQLGLAYALDGKHELALEQFDRATRFVPDMADAYHQMGLSYAALSSPTHVIYARGMEAYARKDYAGARADLERVSAELPDFAPAQVGLGLVYEKLGDPAGAKTRYARALALEPDNLLAGYGLIRLGNTQGGR